jgi:hypothetical protein
MIGHDAACSRHGSCALGGRRAYRQADCVSRTYSCRSGTGVRRPHGRSKNGLPITHRLRLTFALTVNDSFVPAPRVRYLFTFAPCVRHHPDPAPATANTLRPPLLCELNVDAQRTDRVAGTRRSAELIIASICMRARASPAYRRAMQMSLRSPGQGLMADAGACFLCLFQTVGHRWLMCTRVMPNVLSGTCGGSTLCYSRLLFHMHWLPFPGRL